MKLEVGMFIRTNLGIEKIISLESEYNVLIAGVGTKQGFIQKKRVLKSSFNLIDLIEVGDLLRIHLYSEIYCIVEVEKISYDSGEEYTGVYIPWNEGSSFEKLEDLDIVEVLTHEQYEANTYKVVE
jgi:hypothetical protein